MLYAHDLLQLHPAGADVYDRHGRKLPYVLACNPLTGEAILWWPLDGLSGWINFKMFQIRRLFNLEPFLMEQRRRHGFWPAPLTVVLKSRDLNN